MAEPEDRLLMLIDDEPAQCRLITALAAREGWRTIIARDSETAIATLGTRQGMQLGAIILDQWVPGDDACALIAELKARRPALPILMLTTSSSPLLAVEAMRAGATDYLIKPVAPDRLLQALRSATTREAPAVELQPLTEKIGAALDFDSMIGAAPSFRAALAVAAKAARTQGTVLIEGETGSGKEMLVRAMHAASPRAKTPLRIVNAGGIPGNQIESVLFGHEKGAFPGAFERQAGALQHADGGTLVIDEIDRLNPHVQERLLQFLERGDVQPIGARHRFRVDVRLIACSNGSLRELQHVGLFRPDLVDVLSTVLVSLPPLRERSGDIPALTRHFLARIGEQPGLRHLGITDGALALLSAYDWPGNVRQLQATLFRAAVFCDNEALTAQDFPNLSMMVGEAPRHNPQHSEGAGVMLYAADGNLRPLEEIEADVIRLAIGHYRGRMSEVARRLGIGRSTLYRKLSELGIDNAA
ncbi:MULTISPECIES: sigma-54 dependent transcriptional regulator [unclassified Novosphingobium]|jgi:DNA-binding NtrC family response regulator|uniref:sigma-54-dependent transcriptional regulator n=1 Tax=unclassified Novosphingobium TaxID=2644732 RepID=UPI000F5E9AE8|nr:MULTISPECIES: sigma-54 dependent transcriptional regulator [unclassified Novosphingobium]MBF5092093.1 sigma-54-dependent Fis family transcriptional regulator [Novosphingobium sp. NBM11]RQW46006.1 sigma-54-dependent Fis family transcriptional regulator [Novosphingobium sp. LASN5T]